MCLHNHWDTKNLATRPPELQMATSFKLFGLVHREDGWVKEQLFLYSSSWKIKVYLLKFSIYFVYMYGRVFLSALPVTIQCVRIIVSPPHPESNGIN